MQRSGVQKLNFEIRITKWKTMLILVSASERMDFNRIVRFELHIRTSSIWRRQSVG